MKALVAFAALLPMLATAQVQSVPQTIGYQGRLLKADGTPLNTKVNVNFRIYAQATGDTSLALWTEQQDVTPNSGGFYAVFLGAVTPFGANVFTGADRWLGLSVGADSELVPRQKIGSVAYALRAGHAVTADSAASVTGGNVSTGAISASSLNLSGKGTSAETVAGDPANTMVTKGYVDAAPPDAAGSMALDTRAQWSGSSLVQYANRLTVAHLWVWLKDQQVIPAGQTIATMPVGYRPRIRIDFPVTLTGNCSPVGAQKWAILSDGRIISDHQLNAQCNYVCQAVYVSRAE